MEPASDSETEYVRQRHYRFSSFDTDDSASVLSDLAAEDSPLGGRSRERGSQGRSTGPFRVGPVVVPTQSTWRNKEAPVLSEVATIAEAGSQGTLDYSMRFLDSRAWEISPLHGIPLHATETLLTVVCKTPKGLWIEAECSGGGESEEDSRGFGKEGGTDAGSPAGKMTGKGELEGLLGRRRGCGKGGLKLKSCDGRPTHYAENALWNIGMLPQTWANPELPNMEYGGIPYDGRPMEVIDIGAKTGKVGEIYAIKPLAAFAVIEMDHISKQPELSWKIIGVRSNDLGTVALDDVADVNRRMPGLLEEIREWLRTCHCIGPDDKPCLFGLNERAAGRDEAIRVVKEAHASWQLLVTRFPTLLTRMPPLESARGAAIHQGPIRTLSPDSPLDADLDAISPKQRRQDWFVSGILGDKITLSDPSRGKKVRYERAWAEGAEDALPDKSGSDAESVKSGRHSSTPNGSLTRRQGQRAVRTAPRFARPAYIQTQPQGESGGSGDGEDDDEFDIDDLEFKTSALCLAMHAKKPLGKGQVGGAPGLLQRMLSAKEGGRFSGRLKLQLRDLQISGPSVKQRDGSANVLVSELSEDLDQRSVICGYSASGSEEDSGWDMDGSDIVSVESTPRGRPNHGPMSPHFSELVRMNSAPRATTGRGSGRKWNGQVDVQDDALGPPVEASQWQHSKPGQRPGALPLSRHQDLHTSVASPSHLRRPPAGGYRTERQNRGGEESDSPHSRRQSQGSQGREQDGHHGTAGGWESSTIRKGLVWEKAREQAPEHHWRGSEPSPRRQSLPPSKLPGLASLPQHVDEIAMQLDATDVMHARFNSRLADAKVILARLRAQTAKPAIIPLH